jgi:hypothetical protein
MGSPLDYHRYFARRTRSRTQSSHGCPISILLTCGFSRGQKKEAEISGTALKSTPVDGNIRHGFVYERVPHITLKSIANNAEIDVIWEKWQKTLEPLREKLNSPRRQSLKSGKSPEKPTRSGRKTHGMRTPNGGRHALPDRKKSIHRSPTKQSTNISMTAHTKINNVYAWQGHSQ